MFGNVPKLVKYLKYDEDDLDSSFGIERCRSIPSKEFDIRSCCCNPANRISHGPHLPTSLVVRFPSNQNLLSYLLSTLFGCNREIVGFGKNKLYYSRSDMVIDEEDTDFGVC